jgi:Na+/phosphate symporter
MWFEAFYTLGGGLALFFMGISHLKTGMRSLAGQGLKNALASMARNRIVLPSPAWLAAFTAST